MTDPDQLQSSLPLPVSTELLNLLDSFSRHTLAIFDDLSAPQHVAAAAPAAAPTRPLRDSAPPAYANEHAMPFATSLRSLNALSDLDEQLASLLHKAKKHEANQRRIEALEEEMVRYESEWRAEIIALDADRKRLGRLVAEGRKDRERIEKAAQAQLKPSTILSYARMLAPYTSAPPRHIRFGTAAETGEQRAAYQQNPASIPGAILPYPSEEVMRQGRLAFAESGDVGETTNMTGTKPASPKVGDISTAFAGAQPVPKASDITRKPLHAMQKPPPPPDDEEDFGFDLDLNPDL